MKAAQISEYGDPSVVVINEIEKPTVNEGQVLVEVHAASLNPFDTTIRTGKMKDAIQLPVTLGGDIAGVVVEVGQGVSDFAVGDKVYGQANAVAGNSGAFAEYAATKATQVAKMPANPDYQGAASLSLVGVSALQALTNHINLQAGQKLFIHGGAGGIGTIAIQIAKSLGAYVATTATGDNISAVKELGADEVIDYKTENFVAVLHDYDAVFDTVGGDDFARSLEVLKAGGTAVSMIAAVDESQAMERRVTALTQATKVTTEALEKLCELVEAGDVTPQVGKVYRLDQIREAFTARETGSIRGKVVLEVKQ